MNSASKAPIITYDYAAQISAFKAGCFRDAFSFLGLHSAGQGSIIRVYIPGAQSITVIHGTQETELQRIDNSALFVFQFSHPVASGYLLKIQYPETTITTRDVYDFSSALDEAAMYLFNEGSLEHGYLHFGARAISHQGCAGTQFCVWAPNARSVSVIGEFNHWQPNQHFMRFHPASGVWDLFIPHLTSEQGYKYSIVGADGVVTERADPYAIKMQQAPGTASVIQPQQSNLPLSPAGQERRRKRNAVDAPITIYEVHLGSWKRREQEDGRYLTYRELADDLLPYVKGLGFTHIQLMPISEYPFDGSWGYQPVGLFAPTSRFGSLEDFSYFIGKCAELDLGILVDWVPGHFPSDPHGLHRFDGTHLYEHADSRQGFHPDWNTYIYNYERPEVKSFLLSNANYWLDVFKLDGLRVDAVASMLYLDYSRKDGEWVPNQFGGRENLGAIDCIRAVNTRVYGRHPHVMMIAEESTAWPGVTQAVEHNGLGFGYKWNMGWMNDSLSYMQRDPVHRKYHHHEMTFSMAYAYSENYVLPLSHDEVVHGKGSLLSKMPGDDWQQFANLRAYYGFMYAHPGKKLLFMGSELAPRTEWDHNSGLDWTLLESSAHNGVYQTIKSLNHLYTTSPALFELDNSPCGFQWIDCHNGEQSILSFARFGKSRADLMVVVSHFTPQVLHSYRIGVPQAGIYQVVFNSDDTDLFGSGIAPVAHQQQMLQSKAIGSHGFEHSIEITIPPLSTVYLQYLGTDKSC
ncbi:1,4-alpha-glucan branching protein GlgB [Pseudoalteromonas sp. R3]|uniref:1,4-alpha-glucan branching protein GlgB n=1 Tax=Pseudoalteromonas sp. R3 TaxID=1709477 RepID=UPI0006B4BBE9|nr:1,4-alpha-glucan branching protein GlgB [Pseudoalteromonas sp. R3]AZZ95925.1 1,4-alpha-glucan branching protein GlgB [Pseudoalteromonas sp. R3]